MKTKNKKYVLFNYINENNIKNDFFENNIIITGQCI